MVIVKKDTCELIMPFLLAVEKVYVFIWWCLCKAFQYVRQRGQSVIMQENLLYINTWNLWAAGWEWIAFRGIPSRRGNGGEHLSLWQRGRVVHLVNFLTAWKIFITKCHRDELFSKLWSHCLRSALNQFTLLPLESHFQRIELRMLLCFLLVRQGNVV